MILDPLHDVRLRNSLAIHVAMDGAGIGNVDQVRELSQAQAVVGEFRVMGAKLGELVGGGLGVLTRLRRLVSFVERQRAG